jgi:hypothetical protein
VRSAVRKHERFDVVCGEEAFARSGRNLARNIIAPRESLLEIEAVQLLKRGMMIGCPELMIQSASKEYLIDGLGSLSIVSTQITYT